MKAEIVSTGTELLLGEITDTNSSYLASQLPALGIDLYWITLVGDNRERLVEALRRAWERSDLVLTTGGLGPTDGDLTRETIAEMLGEEMKVDPNLEKDLREFFARRNLQMPSRNIKQVTLIPSAQSIPNPRGTAPGWWVERGRKIIVAMPGPPWEMQYMWEKEIVPRLRQRTSGVIILTRTIKTSGLGEALVAEMVSPLTSSANPTLGIYAKLDGIHLRLGAKANSREEAKATLAQGEARLREILGDCIWGVDEESLESVVGKLLLSKGLTLATLEFCTGGLLAATLTAVPQSPAFYKGGLIVNSVEMALASGVSSQLISHYGASSPEVAEAMATISRERLKADVGVGITGIAAAKEQEEKPPGTVYIAVDNGRKKWQHQGNYPPSPPEVKRRATMASLFGIRRLLLSPD